jgi:ArsR family transcriptional regulator
MAVRSVRPEAASSCESSLGQAEPREETIAMAKPFAALGDPVRLHLLELIAAAGEMCVCDMVEPLGRAQPTVSHHVRVLREAGLVECEKRGAWSWYRAVPGKLDAMRAALSDIESRTRAVIAPA